MTVGNNPDPLPLVIQAGGVCSDNSPPRIVPQRGKVTQHSVESSGNKDGAVFNECVLGLYFANDAGELTPQAAPLALETVDSVVDCRLG
jgi:hypothetical protein